jgi:hypothetical protein
MIGATLHPATAGKESILGVAPDREQSLPGSVDLVNPK